MFQITKFVIAAALTAIIAAPIMAHNPTQGTGQIPQKSANDDDAVDDPTDYEPVQASEDVAEVEEEIEESVKSGESGEGREPGYTFRDSYTFRDDIEREKDTTIDPADFEEHGTDDYEKGEGAEEFAATKSEEGEGAEDEGELPSLLYDAANYETNKDYDCNGRSASPIKGGNLCADNEEKKECELSPLHNAENYETNQDCGCSPIKGSNLMASVRPPDSARNAGMDKFYENQEGNLCADNEEKKECELSPLHNAENYETNQDCGCSPIKGGTLMASVRPPDSARNAGMDKFYENQEGNLCADNEEKKECELSPLHNAENYETNQDCGCSPIKGGNLAASGRSAPLPAGGVENEIDEACLGVEEGHVSTIETVHVMRMRDEPGHSRDASDERSGGQNDTNEVIMSYEDFAKMLKAVKYPAKYDDPREMVCESVCQRVCQSDLKVIKEREEREKDGLKDDHNLDQEVREAFAREEREKREKNRETRYEHEEEGYFYSDRGVTEMLVFWERKERKKREKEEYDEILRECDDNKEGSSPSVSDVVEPKEKSECDSKYDETNKSNSREERIKYYDVWDGHNYILVDSKGVAVVDFEEFPLSGEKAFEKIKEGYEKEKEKEYDEMQRMYEEHDRRDGETINPREALEREEKLKDDPSAFDE